MSKLQLSVAVGNYDRVRPLIDGAVQIDGVDPVFMNLPPEEIFFRAFRSEDFDICELSMSSFTVKTAERNCPYVGVPAFVSRAFRHNSIYVRKDRIKSPADLKGRRVGLPEYQLTACVWARIILEDDHGVKPSDIVWVRGGIEHPGRPEKITIKLPPGVRMEDAPAGATISELLERGDIDGFIAPRVPSLAAKNNPDIGWLFRRSDRRRPGLFQAHRHFSDHACHRRPARAGGKAPVAAGGGVQGVRAVEGEVPRGARGHRREQGHAAVRGGAAARRARASWATTSGPTGSRRTARCWRRSCVTTMRRACRRDWWRRRSCSIPRPTRASRFRALALRAWTREAFVPPAHGFSVPRSMAAVVTAE